MVSPTTTTTHVTPYQRAAYSAPMAEALSTPPQVSIPHQVRAEAISASLKDPAP